MSGILDDNSGGGGFAGMLERMPSLDALTVAVLGIDAYMLFTQLDYYNKDVVLSVTADPQVLALQGTVLLVGIYVLEFMHDRKGGGH